MFLTSYTWFFFGSNALPGRVPTTYLSFISLAWLDHQAPEDVATVCLHLHSCQVLFNWLCNSRYLALSEFGEYEFCGRIRPTHFSKLWHVKACHHTYVHFWTCIAANSSIQVVLHREGTVEEVLTAGCTWLGLVDFNSTHGLPAGTTTLFTSKNLFKLWNSD